MSGLRILVTGATGRTGKELIQNLKQSGENVYIKACCRDLKNLDVLKSYGADDVVQFDYDNEETFKNVLDNINAIQSSSPDNFFPGHKKFCELIKANANNIKHIVRLSCFGAEQNTASQDHNKHISAPNAGIPKMLQGYWNGEKVLIDTGVPVTALRGNFFMGHLLKTEADHIQNEGQFTNPLGDTKNSFVSTNDLGTAGAKVFLDGPGRHGNCFYDITGGVSQSMYEIAEDLSKALGKEIKYKAQSLTDFEKDYGPTRREFFEYLCNGFYSRCSPDYYNITKKLPTTWQDYLVNKGAAGETGLDEMFKSGGMWSRGKDAMKDAKHE